MQQALQKHGSTVILRDTLKGGIVSQVYTGTLGDKPVVVKHTDDFSPDYPTNLLIDKGMQNVDAFVLKRLENSVVRVPELIETFPKLSTTIMEDLSAMGYTLLSSAILQKHLPAKSAYAIGANLAALAQIARSWKPFDTIESAESSMHQRGLELRLAYPNNAKAYDALKAEHTQNAQYWVWADSHPKNILYNAAGDAAFIDFGESYWGDQRFMLPNFLAHIVVYTLAGYIDRKEASSYISQCIAGYREKEPIIDEHLFCKYLAMEIIHRSNGRWIEGIESAEQKLTIYRFGLGVYEDVTTLDSFVRMLTS